MLSEFCEFGDMLDEMIRDHLVCGINDKKIQQKLLTEPELTLAKTMQMAQVSELAKQDVTELNKGHHKLQVVQLPVTQ